MGAGASSSNGLQNLMLDHGLRQLPNLVNRDDCIRFVGESIWNQEYDRLFNEYQKHSVVSKEQLVEIVNAQRARTATDQSDASSYVRIQKLGKGSFGVVWIVRRAHDDAICVMKMVQMMSKKERKAPREARSAALREAQFLCNLSHPNIVAFVDAFARGSALCIVMSFCECGDLARRIKAARKRGMHFREERIMMWFVQLVLAIDYLHGQSPKPILHRDIKPANIFLSHGGNLLKIGDFGVSKALSDCVDQTDTRTGTPLYMSPEMVAGNKYGLNADIWAMGVVLFELAALRTPFTSKHMYQLCDQIMTQPPPSLRRLYSSALDDMVRAMLHKQERHRPSAKQILRMPHIQWHLCRFRDEIAISSSAAIVSKQPLARSKTLVSFDHLLATHHQRQEMLQQEEKTRLLHCINQRIAIKTNISRRRLQPLPGANKLLKPITHGRVLGDSKSPFKAKPKLQPPPRLSDANKRALDDGTAWSKRHTLDDSTLNSSSGGSTGLKSMWLTPTPETGSNAMPRNTRNDTQWAAGKTTLGTTMSSTGNMSRTFANRKVTVDVMPDGSTETGSAASMTMWRARKVTVDVMPDGRTSSSGAASMTARTPKVTVEVMPDERTATGGAVRMTRQTPKVTVDEMMPDERTATGGAVRVTAQTPKVTVEEMVPDERAATGGAIRITARTPKVTVDEMTSQTFDTSRMTVQDQLLHSMKRATNGSMLKDEWMWSGKDKDDDEDDFITGSSDESDSDPGDSENPTVNTVLIEESGSDSETGAAMNQTTFVKGSLRGNSSTWDSEFDQFDDEGTAANSGHGYSLAQPKDRGAWRSQIK